MNSLNIFLITFLEIGSFMLLWNVLNRQCKSSFYKSIVIMLLMSVTVVITNYFNVGIDIFINYLALFYFLKIIYKKRLKRLLLEFSLVLSVCGVLQLCIVILLRTISPAFMSKDIFINNFIANIICILIITCIFKFIDTKRLVNLYKQEMPRINMFSLNLLIYTLIAKWMWDFKREIFLEEAIFFLVVPAIFIWINMTFFKYHMKNNELRRSLEEYKKYSLVISQLLTDVRRRQHDFKNHLNTIYGLIQISDEKSLKETVYQYMKSINISLENIDRVLQINNKVVTAIIYNKMNEADKAKIEFRYTIDSSSIKLPFKDYELSEVLNNLLDNAFEAVKDPEKKLKKVFLNIGYLEDGCALEIGNTGEKIELNNIGKIFDIGYTTKAGGQHGFGLYNVKKIVESYGGKIQLSFENNYTIFRVMLD